MKYLLVFRMKKDFLPDTLDGSTKQLCLGFVVIINRTGSKNPPKSFFGGLL